MEYHFESLGDERFQQLCQAILSSTYPETQCFPVGMPDGGRDAVVRQRGPTTKDFSVYQVKYVKNPATRESRDFIEEVVRLEAAKAQILKKKGAASYHLMTNVSGSAHLDAGSIDKVNKALSEALGIPAFCWWRDDISRKIDGNSSVKWSFTEILRGADLLQMLIEARDDKDASRIRTLNSYMSLQAQRDNQLKFKQIELHKSILDLFVDVPTRLLPQPGADKRVHDEQWQRIVKAIGPKPGEKTSDHEDASDKHVGGMQLMSKDWFIRRSTKLVVEGAPGQGKSTVTQYLCQIHRLILLNNQNELLKVPQHLRPTTSRIPFRIDLRDYASWLAGRNPFAEDPSTVLPSNASPLLETFIAAQVERQTGATFSVDDLIAVSTRSKLLIVLDGFDEVADIKLRNRIVEEVTDASVRIDGNAISSQIIVTSRPAAFANSPGFPRAEWEHLEILPLSKSEINEYTKKWLDGRGFDPREKREIATALEEKLAHSHVRDLARNPMQLAILLTLISVQGASLPNKRTALYDNYIDIFFNRETEKSPIVRDHRELLIQIHRFLAWTLQIEAEGSGSGNISDSKLKALVREYLEAHDHRTDIVDELFSGMMERVVALVSRIKGTYEFEVQPLREYFAARYLYDTAAYAQAGIACRGDKPQRFDAIARNFYWHNVARFYAGCYSTGELASLIDGLDHIASSPRFDRVGYTVQLGAELLSDYVFSTQPRLAKRLADRISDGPRFIVCLSELYSKRGGETLRLPEGPARDSLVLSAENILRNTLQFDAMIAVGKVLSENSQESRRYEFWISMRPSLEESDWLNLGVALGVFSGAAVSHVLDSRGLAGKKFAKTVLMHERFDVLNKAPELWGDVCDEILDFGMVYITPHRARLNNKTRRIARLSGLVSAYALADVFENKAVRRTVGEFLLHSAQSEDDDDVEPGEHDCKALDESTWINFDKAYSEMCSTSIDAFYSTPLLIENVIEAVRHGFGNRRSLYTTAIEYAAGSTSDSVESIDLTDLSKTVVARALSARSCSANEAFWTRQLKLTIGADVSESFFVLLAIARFMPIALVLKHNEEIAGLTNSFSLDEWKLIAYVQRLWGYYAANVKKDRIRLKDTPANASVRFIKLLLSRADSASVPPLVRKYLLNYVGEDLDIWEAKAEFCIQDALSNSGRWPAALDVIEKGYSKGCSFHVALDAMLDSKVVIPLQQAEIICGSPSKYPLLLVSNASTAISRQAGEEVRSVADIAQQDGWLELA